MRKCKMLLPTFWIKAVEFHTAWALPVEMCTQGWRRLEKVMPNSSLTFVTQKEQQWFIFFPLTLSAGRDLEERSCGRTFVLWSQSRMIKLIKFCIYVWPAGLWSCSSLHRFLAKLQSHGWQWNFPNFPELGKTLGTAENKRGLWGRYWRGSRA